MSDEQKPEPQRRSKRTPPFFVYFIVLASVAIVVLLQLYDRIMGVESTSSITDLSGVDGAYGNLFSYIFGFFAIVTPMLWLAFFSDASRLTRFVPITMLVGLIVLTPALCDVRVDGNMLPTFRWRWLPNPDQQLSAATAEVQTPVVLAMTTPEDFPQFLGPNRNGVVEISLAKDWERQGPKKIWQQPIGAGWSGFVVVNGFAVTLEQRGPNELVTCYEVDTGKLRWSHATEKTRHDTVMGGIGPRSTPTIYNGYVFSIGATGKFNCLDGATGEVVWTKDLLKEFGVKSPDDDLAEIAWGRAGSPLVVDDMVVVPAGGPTEKSSVSIVAYKYDSGELVWKGGETQIGYSSPIVANLNGKRQIISVNEDNATGHDPATGKVLWTIPWRGSSSSGANVSQPVPMPPNRIWLSKGYGQGSALFEFDKADKPTQLWHEPTVMKTKYTNVVVVDGFVYGLSDGILECVEVETGDRQWKRGRFGHGQILLAGDVLLVLSETGELVMVEPTPEKFNELGSLRVLDGKTWNTLCLTGNRLLVRNGEQAACYELPRAID